MKKPYKVLAIVREQPDEDDILTFMATQHGHDIGDLMECAEIDYCTPEVLYNAKTDIFGGYDEVVISQNIFAGPDGPYTIRRKNNTYDDAWITVDVGDAGPVEMSFAAFKNEFENVCRMMAFTALIWGTFGEMEDYPLDVWDDQNRLWHGDFVCGSIYDSVMAHICNLSDEATEMFEDCWERFTQMMEAVMSLPDGMQESLLGETLTYDEGLMEVVKEALCFFPPDGLENITEDSAYEFMISAFMSIYTREEYNV